MALSQPSNDKDTPLSSATSVSSTSTTSNAKGFQKNSERKSSGSQASRNRKGGNNQRSSAGVSDSSTSGPPRSSRSTKNSSLLPPYVKNTVDGDESEGNSISGEKLFRGLSSWEDFLAEGASSTGPPGRLSSQRKSESNESSSLLPGQAGDDDRRKSGRSNSSRTSSSSSSSRIPTSPFTNNEKLPTISDLFPADLSATGMNSNTRTDQTSPPPPTLDGVMPVSDLFYRSAQSMSEDEDESVDDREDTEDRGTMVDPRSASTRDDEELPFSAEQSDQITSSQNRIQVRRNQARSGSDVGMSTPMDGQNAPAMSGSRRKKGGGSGISQRLVRRGMEMLVGGIPINADPPQRSIELLYNRNEGVKWSEVITTNSRDFGPMLFEPSVTKLSRMEEALFCEFFVQSALKWDICPKDLRDLVKAHVATHETDTVDKSTDDDEDGRDAARNSQGETSSRLSIIGLNSEVSQPEDFSRSIGKMKQFSASSSPVDVDGQMDSNYVIGGELVFSIGVSKEELESSDVPDEKPVLERVVAKGIASSTDCTGFEVSSLEIHLSDQGDGSTRISADFILSMDESTPVADIEKKIQRIESALARAMDDGDMQLAMAAAAKDETAWPRPLRNRIVEEFLFDDDDLDGPSVLGEVPESLNGDVDAANVADSSTEPPTQNTLPDTSEMTVNSLLREMNYKTSGFGDDADGPFGTWSGSQQNDDIFVGGGNDGVFWNYSESNADNAPYQGTLGLRLVDAVKERAKQREPRVIAIGDVHGCIDELQSLLRECDYRPGDLVVFLGDLVSKGPDSVAVVQMAREIGAIAVRGNHDFEVVRWHQAIKSGVDPPVIGSDHFHIASRLTKADMKWLYSLPWYITSPDLGVLFVHAGFVSGIRLAKQNPRLMMNMRSILPDGTVTSKFFNNWPWARLWDGPQTVLFGHDADRGLQQYEHAIGLDTGCVYGGRLTACILPEKRLVSVNAKREYFKYRRKHYD
jgi:hypothetical protein